VVVVVVVVEVVVVVVAVASGQSERAGRVREAAWAGRGTERKGGVRSTSDRRRPENEATRERFETNLLLHHSSPNKFPPRTSRCC